MGFRPEPTHYRLFFEDPAYADFEVTIARMTVGEALAFDEARNAPAATAAEVTAKLKAIAEQVADRLVSWNLEDEQGALVPATADALLGLEEPLFDAVIDAYIQALRGVPAPLGLGSSGTEPDSSTTSPSPAAGPAALSIPMEPLSDVPQSQPS